MRDAGNEELRQRKLLQAHFRVGRFVLWVAVGGGFLAGINDTAWRIEEYVIIAPTRTLGREVARCPVFSRRHTWLFLKPARIGEEVRRCPRVADCRVERRSWNSVRIVITERPAIAALQEEAGYWLVSREGICLEWQEKRPALPIIRGLMETGLQRGATVPAARWAWVREALAGATRAGTREGLELDFSEPCQIKAKTAEGWECWLGNVNSLEYKMTLAGRVAEALRKQGRRPKWIDVSVLGKARWTTF